MSLIFTISTPTARSTSQFILLASTSVCGATFYASTSFSGRLRLDFNPFRFIWCHSQLACYWRMECTLVIVFTFAATLTDRSTVWFSLLASTFHCVAACSTSTPFRGGHSCTLTCYNLQIFWWWQVCCTCYLSIVIVLMRVLYRWWFVCTLLFSLSSLLVYPCMVVCNISGSYSSFTIKLKGTNVVVWLLYTAWWVLWWAIWYWNILCWPKGIDSVIWNGVGRGLGWYILHCNR